MYTIEKARREAGDIFLSSFFLIENKKNYGIKEALLDADILISYILKKERAWVIAHKDFDFSEFKNEFKKAVQKRKGGLPIAYLTGLKDFYKHSFFVNTNVLIPKPDSELIVEKAIFFLKEKYNSPEHIKKTFYMLDICTGSGCIGISVAAEFFNYINNKYSFLQNDISNFFKYRFKLVLADISDSALKVCKKNAKTILPDPILQNTLIINSDLKETFYLVENKKYDLITANPPYVPSIITKKILADGRKEPHLALDGGEDGLDLIKPLAINAFTALNTHGKIFTEVGEYHSEEALSIFKNAGFHSSIIYKDLSGQDRIIEAEKN